jgi:TusA-related sulfurtransferase
VADKVIDARGAFCPGPMMELIRSIKTASVGEILAVYTTDPGSKNDIPLWCKKAGHEFIEVIPHDGFEEIVVKKAR